MVTINFRMKKSGVPILRKDEIEGIAETLLHEYNPRVSDEPGALDIEHFSESYVGLEMDYQDLSHNQSILGMMVFHDCLVPVYDTEKKEAKRIKAKEGTVLIDNSLLRDGQMRRGRFTVGHEVGHWLLHKSKHKVDNGRLSLFERQPEPITKCRISDIEKGRRKFTNDDDWMEWQADYISSALLMPQRAFSRVVIKKFRRAGIKTDHYKRGTDISLDLWTQFLSYELADVFQVSVAAARIRLENLQLIQEKAANRRFCWQ